MVSPSVSVVIPTYNDQSTLVRAISSALQFDWVREVIVVDDGSNPPARDALTGLRDVSRLRVLEQPNAGVSVARNAGLDASTTDHVILLDADDALRPEVLVTLSVARTTGAPLTVAGRRCLLPDGSEHIRLASEHWITHGYYGFVPRPADVFRLRPILVFVTSGMVVSRNAIAAGLRFDPLIRHGQDIEFARRAADLGPIAVCRVAAVDYIEKADGSNLSGFRHLNRISRDFLRILELHHRPEDDDIWREFAAWRIKRYSKYGTDERLWNDLVAAFEARRLPIPAKARLRWRLRRLAAAALAPFRSRVAREQGR